MFAGAELGKAIDVHGGCIEATLAAFEAAMFPRSASEAADAHVVLELCLRDRAPFGLIEFFTGMREGAGEGGQHLIHTADELT